MTRERRRQRRLGRVYPRGKRTHPVTATTRERRKRVTRWAGEISLMEEGHVLRSYICTTGLNNISRQRTSLNRTRLFRFSLLSLAREILAPFLPGLDLLER